MQNAIEEKVAKLQADEKKNGPKPALLAEEKTIEKLYLEVDGSMVPLKKEWKEAKLVVSFEQKDRATTGKDRPVLLNKNYT